ncbi:MAG TPA: hypothetical protein VG675_23845 [Bryobacteraceae bacterium]|nr:hypothetical protein [Bryobacteraceae bacterium]
MPRAGCSGVFFKSPRRGHASAAFQEIVVTCPPSMLLQWQEELEQRFGLLFEIFDKDFVAQIRRERGFGVNPGLRTPVANFPPPANRRELHRTDS